MKDKQEFTSDDEMSFGNRVAIYHKKLLEKNPLAISVALIVSIIYLRTLGFVDMVIEGMVCYAISFYVVPAVCNGNWSKVASKKSGNRKKNKGINLQSKIFEETDGGITKNQDVSIFDRYDMNRNSPSSPLHKSSLCKKI